MAFSPWAEWLLLYLPLNPDIRQSLLRSLEVCGHYLSRVEGNYVSQSKDKAQCYNNQTNGSWAL